MRGKGPWSCGFGKLGINLRATYSSDFSVGGAFQRKLFQTPLPLLYFSIDHGKVVPFLERYYYHLTFS